VKTSDSLVPAGIVSGGVNEKTVLVVIPGASIVELPICSPSSDAVSVSELKSPGLLTETVAEDTICAAVSDRV
jgi:hypothetical protein